MPRKPVSKPKGCFQRGPIWWGRIEIGGTEHRESLRTTDPEQAGQRRAEWVAKLQADAFRASVPLLDPEPAAEPGPHVGGGGPSGGEDRSFKAAVMRWEDEVLDGCKPSVRKRYLVSIAQLDPIFGELTQEEITAERVAAYVTLRKGAGKSGKERGLAGAKAKVSNATIRRDLTALSRLLAACCNWTWRIDNPALAFDRKMLKESREPEAPPSPEDIATVVAACPPVVAAIVRLLDNTGFRMNEAVQIERWQVRDGNITLSKTKSNRPRVVKIKTPGGDAAEALAIGAKLGFLYRSPETGKAYANFSSNFAQITRRVVEAEKAAGRDFRRFSIKDLRSGFAVRWLRAGASLGVLSKHLGHSSVKVTESNYIDWLTAEEQARVQSEVMRLMALE